jgi:23S rRNA G2069 N7-methylase RlmK/C1962 C5-methylase RlmI
VTRQTEREKQLQKRYAELMEELKELSQQNGVAYTNGNAQE